MYHNGMHPGYVNGNPDPKTQPVINSLHLPRKLRSQSDAIMCYI